MEGDEARASSHRLPPNPNRTTTRPQPTSHQASGLPSATIPPHWSMLIKPPTVSALF